MSSTGAPVTVPFFIGGQSYEPEKSFEVTSPKSGEVVHHCGSASLKDAESAVAAAAAAFPSWRQTTPSQRRDILLKAAEIMEKRREELVGIADEETGGGEHWANFNVTVSVDLIKDAAGRVASLEGSYPMTKDNNVSAIIMREPFGVVLSIAPWSVL